MNKEFAHTDFSRATIEPKTSGSRAVPISIRNLSLSFGTVDVLKGINLEIVAGEFFAFLGPSGSGKSTLLRAIAGFGPKPRGEILLGKENIVGQSPWKRNVGMVFQNYALWPHMTVRQNVAYGLEERRVPHNEIGKRVDSALDLVGLSHVSARYPSQLSGGQQQRVALARTIVIEPRILLLDEPLSNLDANLRVQMRQDILKLQRDLCITTIFVTHDQEEANTICDRIAVMSDGIVRQVGRPDELYDNPANPFVAQFLGTANMIEGGVIRQDGNVVFVNGSGLEIPLDRHETRGNAILVVRPQGLRLTDLSESGAFMGKLTGSEFLGETIRYFVNANGVQLSVDEVHSRGAHRRSVGDNVHILVNPGQAVLLRP